jgi:4-hydroxy-2-oxoheptanedioate aldolase
MEIARELKRKIASGRVTTGVLATFHLWTGLVEILRNAGFDYVIADLEHGAFDDALIRDVCAIGRMIGFPVIVRTISADYPFVRKAIDLGPCGLMFPCVEDSATLDRARDAIYLPPRGKRRPGGAGNAWVKNYDASTWKTEVEDDFIVLPQIESLQGLANAEAIAGHELTTAIAVGPYDLSAELGLCWKPDHPAFREAIERIRRAGQSAGKNMWMIGDGSASLRQGFTFLCIGEATSMFSSSLIEANRKVKPA